MSPAQANRSDGSAWNREAAAAYLDQRMDIWFEKGEKLQTGAARTTCVSCHTVIPYALARPALRRAMHVNELTPQEARLVDETSRRVQASDRNSSCTRRDEGQSNGTEAVLYALILASADAGAAFVSRATRHVARLTRMWQTQRDDGAWDWLDVGLEPFESIDSAYQGAAFAALAVGLAPTLSTGPERARSRQAARRTCGTIMPVRTSTTASGACWRPHRCRAVAAVRRSRRLSVSCSAGRAKMAAGRSNGLGGWRWNRTAAPFQSPGQRDQELAAQSDGYATGLIVYTLRQAGVPAEHAIDQERPAMAQSSPAADSRRRSGMARLARPLSQLRSRARRCQRRSRGSRLFMSDAATAFATLGLLASD